MADIFRPWSPGDPINGIPSAFLNVLTRMAKEFLRKEGLGKGESLKQKIENRVVIKNVSGDERAQFSVVAIGEPLINPSGEDTYFFGDEVFESASPTATAAFAITQEPANINALSPAILSGTTFVKINMLSASHSYAVPIAADYTRLASATTGPARIVWREGGSTLLDGGIDDAVTTLDVDSSEDFPEDIDGDDFVVTIGTEDILVTDISGNVWTVERGYNSTTPASHADNAPVAFKTGEVWALVILIGAASGTGTGITSINADTAVSQVLTVGTDDTHDDLWIEDDLAGNHIIQVPDASRTCRGIVSISGVQEFEGNKVFVQSVDSYGSLSSSDETGTLGSASINWYATGWNATRAIDASITTGGTDVNGNTVTAEALLHAGVRNVGNTNWSSRTLFILGGATSGPTFDAQPSYAVGVGGSYYTGQWGTDAAGNTVSGGLITTIGSNLPYTPTTSGDWNGAAPTTVQGALDRCAALLKTLNGGTGP